MAFKFGAIFDNILKAATGGAAGKKTAPVDTSNIDKLSKGLENLSLKSKAAAKEVKQLREREQEAEAIYGRGSAVHLSRQKELAAAQSRATSLSQAETKVKTLLSKETEDIIDIETKTTTSGKKYAKSISDINGDYTKGVKKTLENTKLSAKDREKELAKLKKTRMSEQMSAMWTDTEGAVKAGADNVSAIITEGIVAIAPELAPFMAIIEESIGAAFKQVIELNDSLIKLQRATGGMITVSRLGFDAFGNSTSGMQSLKTATIGANVSIGEFDAAMSNLASGGFGQTIGTTQDLSKAQQDLSKYGLEASRAMKMYGADLGPSVRNLFQNFGKGIGEATDLLKDGADKAKQLGLNAKEFVKNFEGVTDLIGEVYFVTTNEMQKMATIATQLGVSVGTMAKGLIKMEHITDLFTNQQKMAALGLDTTAKALSKIYALRMQGKGGEAAKVEFASLAKDMQKQGMTKGGQVTQQGIMTLEAAGVTKDAIAGIQKMAMMAEKTGIDVGQLGDTSKLTKMQQLKIAKEEAANMTLEEQFGQITGLLKQTLIDPLAAVFGPILKTLLNIGTAMITFFQPLVMAGIAVARFVTGFDFLINIIDGIGIAFSNFTATVQLAYKSINDDLIQPVANFLAPAFKMLSSMFTGLGTLIGNVLLPVLTAYAAFQIHQFMWSKVKWTWEKAKFGWDKMMFVVSKAASIAQVMWQWLQVAGLIAMYAIETLLTGGLNLIIPVIVALGAALIYWWDEIIGAFKTAYDWIMSWFSSDTETKGTGNYKTNWDEVLGTTPTPNTPNAANVGTAIAGNQATAAAGATNTTTNNNSAVAGNKTTVVVQNDVDPTFGDKNTYKYTV